VGALHPLAATLATGLITAGTSRCRMCQRVGVVASLHTVTKMWILLAYVFGLLIESAFVKSSLSGVTRDVSRVHGTASPCCGSLSFEYSCCNHEYN
jgi:hypothetical protein